jgi:hydroxypyruvate reductase
MENEAEGDEREEPHYTHDMSKPHSAHATDTRPLLTALYECAVRTALPDTILKAHLPPPPKGRLAIIAIGKAAASMAAAAETHYADHPLEGIALTRHGHGAGQMLRQIELIEAGHPTPDANGIEASTRIMALAASLGPDDLALVLLSGGGSALATLPIKGVSLADKQALTRALIASGAPIRAINIVRKHLSHIKGGRLAAALAPTPSLTLAISDVVGDDATVIASGPTVPDPTSKADALAILKHWKIDTPDALIAALNAAPESPKPEDPIFDKAAFRLIANGAGALDAAASMARAAGYEVLNLGDGIEGEAQNVARAHAALACAAQAENKRLAILSGGELAVTFGTPPAGRGGPNQEYALALAITLHGADGISALAGDTDGIDGGSGSANDPAGAMIFSDTLARAAALGLDPASALQNHDSSRFFERLGDLLETGPSFTNINDFRVILVEQSSAKKAG